jgi:cytochrome bd ubiquinol oxidase subunit I
VNGGLLLAEPAQLLPAREQMAATLMFHIIFVPIGVALPAFILIANFKGLRHNDGVALTLARRWSHAMGLTFAVGAASGTVLSFEMGLLWPGLTGRFGQVFGLPFAIEGIAFFLEAILVAIYIFGWRRLRPWTHFWLGVPIPFVSLAGAFSIISANAWMNMPAGFTLASNGEVTNIDPGAAILNKALPYEFTHFILAACLAAGFTVASIYVVGWLRGRRDRYHRLGILIPFTIAAVLTPIQFVVGDRAAIAIFKRPTGEVRRHGGRHDLGCEPGRDPVRPVPQRNQHRGRWRPDPGHGLLARRRQHGHLCPGHEQHFQPATTRPTSTSCTGRSTPWSASPPC